MVGDLRAGAGAVEEGTQGGGVVAEGAVVEGGEAGVVADGVVGRVVEEEVDHVGSVSLGGIHEDCLAPFVAVVDEGLEMLGGEVLGCGFQDEGGHFLVTDPA